MEPHVNACEAHEQFLAAVPLEAAYPLLVRCPDCDVTPLTPQQTVDRALKAEWSQDRGV